MKVGRSGTAAVKTKVGKSQTGRTQVVVLTGDAEFEQEVRQTFASSDQIVLRLVRGVLSAMETDLDVAGATVVVVDLQANQQAEMSALERLTARVGPLPPIVVITQAFDEGVARTLLRMRVADFLIKPVSPVELVRTCARVARASAATSPQTREAEILTFLPAVGGAGVTMLAVQSAIMLLNDTRRGKASSCLVDLDFQHGACADYLDLEPRLDLNEIEPRPERLDRQLLEVMLSHHSSGLAVVAAPNRPAEMRTFDPEMVTQLLDLVSSHFDHVVFDMPRTWFSWTDNVLLGSNRLFIVSEMTVPGLRHAKQLVDAVRERLADGPRPEVLINRFEQRLFSSGLRKGDIEQVLGDAFAGCIPNNYALVREAIDRGVPLDEVKPKNKITMELRKLMLSKPAAEPARSPSTVAGRKLNLALARG